MEARDQIAVRRAAIFEAAPRRWMPGATVYADVAVEPLDALVAALNAGGRLLPGLRAEREHLVVRAAARALRRHPHFGNLLLPGGASFEVERTVVSVALDGPGSTGFSLVAEPDQLPLEQVVAELDAATEESRERQHDDLRRAVRRRHTRPLVQWLVNDALLGSLTWVRDRVKLPPGFIRMAVEQTGNLLVHPLGRCGAVKAAATLVGARPAQVLICAPRQVLSPEVPDGREVLALGLTYDQRLFEPHEAAALLADMVALLAEPAERLA